jgi:probable F420-dependent oxidoreductase
MSRFKVGVQLHPQHTSVAELRDAWRAADDAGIDSVWIWDHFFPLYDAGAPYLWPPPPDTVGRHFEAWSLLGAMAADTRRAKIGVLVSNINLRNPDLLADMARTVDHLSGGRVILALGAGNIERDFREYGYGFPNSLERLAVLESALERIARRVGRLDPPPLGDLPVLIGGSGPKVTLRLAAQHGSMWGSFGPPEDYAEQNRRLTEWCARLGRDPKEIERTVLLDVPEEADRIEDFLAAGAEHVIVGCAHPFDLGPARRLLALAAVPPEG